MTINRSPALVPAFFGTGIGTGQRGTKGESTIRWVPREPINSNENQRGGTGRDQKNGGPRISKPPPSASRPTYPHSLNTSPCEVSVRFDGVPRSCRILPALTIQLWCARTLSKLLKLLKERLTVAEAAQQLSILFGAEASEADVLRLALNGHLKLSVFLPRPTWALLGNFINVDDAYEHFPPDAYTPVEEGDDWYDREHNISARRQNNYNEWVSSKDTLIVDGGRKQVLEIKSGVEIEGVWDLTMRGGERDYIERLHRRLTVGRRVKLNEPQKGVQNLGEVPVVRDATEQENAVYALLPEPPFVDFFPKGSRLVVRSTALEELEACIAAEQPPGTEIITASKTGPITSQKAVTVRPSWLSGIDRGQLIGQLRRFHPLARTICETQGLKVFRWCRETQLESFAKNSHRRNGLKRADGLDQNKLATF